MKEKWTKEYLYSLAKIEEQVKLIEYEKNNTWLYQSKLNGYKYIAPVVEEGTTKIDKRQLESILNNLKLIKNSLTKNIEELLPWNEKINKKFGIIIKR